MTIKNKIEKYIGSYSDDNALNNWLKQGAHLLIHVIRPEDVHLYATEKNVTSSGLSILDHRLVLVHKGGNKAYPIPVDGISKIARTTSPYYATDTFPKYTIKEGKIYVYPTEGKVITIEAPAITVDTENVTGLPIMLEPALVLYVAINFGYESLRKSLRTLEKVTFENIEVPETPAAPSFTYTPASIGTYSGTSIAAFDTPPAFTPPSMDTLPTIPSALDISDITPPSRPSDPNLSFSSVNLGTYTDISISTQDLGSAPTFTPVTLTLTDTPGALTISSNAPTSLPSDPSFTWSNANAGTVAEVTIQALPNLPDYTKVSESGVDFSRLGQDANGYIFTQEDLDKAAAEVNVVRAQIDKLQLSLYNELNDVNTNLEGVKVAVQQNMEQARIAIERAKTLGALTNEVNITNAAKALEEQVLEFEAKNKRFLSDLSLYQAKVNTEVSAYATQWDAYAKRQSNLIAKHQNDIQNNLASFNAGKVAYDANITRLIENARLAQQKMIELASATKDVNTLNSVKQLEAAIASYTSELERYRTDNDLYAQKINARVNTYSANLTRYQVNSEIFIRKYLALLESNRESFNASNVAYQSDVLKKVEQAKLTQQKVLEEARANTELNLQNALRVFEEGVKEYEANLARFAALTNIYAEKLRAGFQSIIAQAQRFQVEVPSKINWINSLRSEYMNIIQTYLGVSNAAN